MNNRSVQAKRFSGTPRTSGASTSAQAVPVRPGASNDSKLETACDRLQNDGISPQERFTAWTEALVYSLKENKGEHVAWLGQLHVLGLTGGNEFDACITPSCIDLDDLERLCDWMLLHHVSLPINIAMVGRLVRDAGEMTRLAAILKRPSLQVQSLRLTGGDLHDDAVALLGEALQNSRSLRSLRLDNGALNDESTKQIAHDLKGMPCLESLDISHNSCGSVGLGAVAEALAGNHALRKLRLAGLGAAGGLAAIFATPMPGIEEIDLTSASYSDADAQALGRMLVATKTLKVLDVAFPSDRKREDGAAAMTVDGRQRIFDGLRKNSTLARLNIRSWCLDDGQVEALCEVLRSPKCCLETIEMKWPEGDSAKRALEKAVLGNETLVKLNVSRPNPSWIEATCKRNRAHQEQLPSLMPPALHAIFHHAKLPFIPLEVLNIIGTQLDVVSQLNVEKAAKNTSAPRPALKADKTPKTLSRSERASRALEKLDTQRRRRRIDNAMDARDVVFEPRSSADLPPGARRRSDTQRDENQQRTLGRVKRRSPTKK